MDAGVAAVLGATTGALGALVVASVQVWSQRDARRDQARQELVKDRLHEYVQLLTGARELRFVALRTFHHLAVHTPVEVDALRTQMSHAYYMIAITAPKDTAEIAWRLREDAFDLWDLARDKPESDRKVWLAAVRKVRDTAETFRMHVHRELGIAAAEPSGPTDEELLATSLPSEADG